MWPYSAGCFRSLSGVWAFWVDLMLPWLFWLAGVLLKSLMVQLGGGGDNGKEAVDEVELEEVVTAVSLREMNDESQLDS